MSVQHLTKTVVANAVAVGDKTRIYDDVQKGFHLTVYASGAKTWGFRYDIGVRQRFINLGNALLIHPDQARKQAADLRARVRLGENPSDIARENRTAPTVAELFDRYFLDHAPKKKPKSAAEDLRIYKREIAPRFDKIAAKDLTRSEVSDMMFEIVRSVKAARETAGNRGDGKHSANRAFSLLSKAFSLAEEWGIIPPKTSPCLGVKKFREEHRERILTPEEIAALGATLSKFQADASIPFEAVALVRMALFTGLREGELMRLRWEWIDYSQKRISIPDAKHGGTAHATLIPEAEKLLGSIPGTKTGQVFPWVHFPKNHWEKIVQDTKIPDLHFHDLRHVFGSYAAREGASQRVISKILNHKQLATTERYVNALNSDVSNAAKKTGSAIAGMLAAPSVETEPKKPGKKKECDNENQENIKISIKGKTPEEITKITAMLSILGAEIV